MLLPLSACVLLWRRRRRRATYERHSGRAPDDETFEALGPDGITLVPVRIFDMSNPWNAWQGEMQTGERGADAAAPVCATEKRYGRGGSLGGGQSTKQSGRQSLLQSGRQSAKKSSVKQMQGASERESERVSERDSQRESHWESARACAVGKTRRPVRTSLTRGEAKPHAVPASPTSEMAQVDFCR